MVNGIGNLAIYGLLLAWYIVRQNEGPLNSHEDSLSNTLGHQRQLNSLERRINEREVQTKRDTACQRAKAWAESIRVWAESRKVHGMCNKDVQRACRRAGGWFWASAGRAGGC